jgi:hypothetical protein
MQSSSPARTNSKMPPATPWYPNSTTPRSTHNFIDTDKAMEVGVMLLGVRGLRVAVAHGNRLTSLGCCHAMKMTVHDEAFHIDCYDLTLGSYDIVLEVQWLESLGPILWDFSHDTQTFVHNGHHVTWSSSTISPAPTTVAMLAVPDGELMEALLQEFAPLFSEPQGLPPPQSCSHQIHLLPGTSPMAV